MKKIISIILSIGIIMSVIPIASASFTDVENCDEIDVVAGLGIMEGNVDGTFLPENPVTRSEFAKIMANIYNYGNENNEVEKWKESFFKDVEEETSLILVGDVTETVEIFEDVSETDEAYDAIKLVSDKGIMVGTGNNTFSPDSNITVEQMIKVVVGSLGYGVEAIKMGGYPNGYIAVASDIGLTKGLTDYSQVATRKDVATLLYNALEIELMQFKLRGSDGAVFETVEGDTFLTKLLNLQKVKGRMTDNGYTTFSGKSVVGDSKVVIDGAAYSVGENQEYIRDYIGRDIECYVNEDETIVYMCLSEKDDTKTITAEEFEEYKGNQIIYYESDSGKEKKIDISAGAMVIKNGTAIESYDESIFDFNYGTITCITPKGENDVDVIVIKEYINFNIDFVDSTNKKIYSESSLFGREINIDDSEKRVVIYDISGNVADAKILTAGSVTNVCIGDTLCEIYITNKAVENAKIKGVLFDDGKTLISVGDSQYEISKDILEASPDMILPKNGGQYTLYLDMFGNIVKYLKNASENDVGFITNVRFGPNDETGVEEIIINYYDVITETIEKTSLPAEFILIYEDEDVQTVKRKFTSEKNITEAYNIIYEYILNKGVRVGGLFRYNTDSEGNIIQLELSAKQRSANNEDDRLVEILVNTETFNGNKYCAGYIGGQVIVNNKAKVIACNYESEGFDYGKGFAVGTRSLFGDAEELKQVKAYTTTADSPVADYIIYTKEVATGISTNPQTVGIVRKVYQGIDEDDNPVQIIQIDAGATEYVVVDDAMAPGNVTNMQGDVGWTDKDGKLHNYTVEKGDIIRYSVNGDGNIDKVMLVFDENADYSDGLTIDGKVYDNYASSRGALAGCIDYWDDSIYTYSNPFSAKYNESTGKNSFSSNAFAWMLYSNEDMRVILASPVRTGEGYLITTTQNLKSGYAYNPDSDIHMINTWSATSCTLVELDGKEVSITTVPISSIKTYENAGASCDRIFLTSRIGQPHNLIAIRGHLK